MRIGIFVAMAGRQAGGVETYEHNLIRALATIDNENEYHIFCTDEQAAASFQVRQDNIHFHVLWPRKRGLSIAGTLPFQLMTHQCTLLHATYIPPLWAPIPYLFTMHDVSVFAHPEFYHRRHRYLLQGLQFLGVKRAQYVLCVSETTRHLVAHHFTLPSHRLAVVYNGISTLFQPLPKTQIDQIVRGRYGIQHPYVLYVGQLRLRHKNLGRLLAAFAQFRQEIRQPVQLVLVGKRSWTTDDLDGTIARLHLQNHVTELGHICDEHLPYLYNGATLFASPSLSEGFGCAVTEAMACGTPVMTSNLSALPEVVGEAAILVDPHAVQDIARGMQRLFTDAVLRDTLRIQGLERARQFEWQRTAAQTLALYQQAAAAQTSARQA